MADVVIIAGGFHPFHPGHYSLYQEAKKRYPKADIYFAASDSTANRPFPFRLKQQLAGLFGIPKDMFVQTAQPYRPVEILSKYDPTKDRLIYIRSDKDRDSTPKPGTKPDGTPSYIQHVQKNMLPFGDFAYIDYVPTVQFGPELTDASRIREVWPRLSPKHKVAMIRSLYPPIATSLPKVDMVVKMFDTVLMG